MKMTRDYINSEIHAIKEAHREAYLLKHPRPVPPDGAEIARALRAGHFTVNLKNDKCSCEVHYNGDYIDRFMLDKMVKVPSITIYLKQAARHKKRWQAFRDRMSIESKSVFQFCYYGEGWKDSIAAVAKLEAFRRFKP